MATRSTISIQYEDGVKTIYCHWDGYPEHHLPILQKHYNTIESIEKLIALGNISVLDDSTDCPEGHDFDNKVDGYCIAYGRDRGEENQEAITYSSFEESMKKERQEYNYIFENGEWRYTE